jgi:hypothetical protein
MVDWCVKRRQSVTIRFKQQAISEIDALIQHGLSIYKASDLLHIHHWYYARWKKTTKAVDILIEQDEHLPFNVSVEAKKLYPGHLSSMNIIKSDLSC